MIKFEIMKNLKAIQRNIQKKCFKHLDYKIEES